MVQQDGSGAPLLEIRGVTKRYGSVVACSDVSLALAPGEVRGLLGENGAGKSTLLNVVAGVVVADAGAILIGGELVPAGRPQVASAMGVGCVHQHLSLVEPLTVWENVTLGERGRMDPDQVVDEIRSLGERYGLRLDPFARVDALSPSDRQRVELLRCLRREPRVLVLDEPTSVLSQAESAQLFEMIRALVHSEQRGVVLISHRLEEILQVTDSVSVMRSGRLVATQPTAATNADALARAMLGRDLAGQEDAAALGVEPVEVAETPVDELTPTRDHEAPVLSMVGVVTFGADGRRVLDGLSLEARRGEIVGIAGVEGNGQSGLVELFSGLAALAAGSVTIAGATFAKDRGASARVGVIPADRHDSGCILSMSLMENLFLGRLDGVTTKGMLRARRMMAETESVLAEHGIVAAGPRAPMWTLSGGNQQRLVLARELRRSPSVLVAEQPTRGLDVGAMEDMWRRLRDVAAAGTAVLLISTELDEILAVSDRVVVLRRGAIVGEMARDRLDIQKLGLLMGGQAA